MIRNITILFGLLACLPWCRADEFTSFPQRPDNRVTELTLANIFSDHMVLQQEKPLRIWGWSKPNTTLKLNFAGQEKSTSSDGQGNWSVLLDPLKSSFEKQKLVVTSGKKTVEVKDVLVGEVWLCGGQSNMEFKLGNTRDADLELLSANYPAIRFIRLPLVSSLTPLADFPVDITRADSPGQWSPCTKEYVANCTGVGYYFARRLQRVLNVPMGIIDSSWGGTMAQHWVTRETLKEIPQVTPYFEKHQLAHQTWLDGGAETGADKRYQADLAAWKEASAKMKPGERKPRQPNRKSYDDPSLVARQPSGMMNGIIAPIAGLSIRGVLFYQGENNCFGDWVPFPKTFPAVISDWRKTFNNAEMPFGIIQISGWSTRRSMTYDMNHPTNIIREVQFKTWQSTPNTSLVVTFDTNSSRNIHPGCKQPVGQRSARWALAEVYQLKDARNQTIQWRGPIYKGITVEAGKCIVQFEEQSARGLVLDQDVDAGFYIAGEDKVFHHARASVNESNRSLIVWSDEVENPVAVRYGWSNLPAGGLMNNKELPAYPFRTDNWPLDSHSDQEIYYVDKK